MCETLRAGHHEDMVTATTGLLLDLALEPKLHGCSTMLMAHAIGQSWRTLFGTVDAWLVWNLAWEIYVTDATNAARTLLYDIHNGKWSNQISHLLDIPTCMLPTVMDSSADFGVVSDDVFAPKSSGIAGDQRQQPLVKPVLNQVC